jgi:hypothetical protein
MSSLLLFDVVSTTFIPGKISSKKGVEVKVHLPNLGRFTVQPVQLMCVGIPAVIYLSQLL